MNCDLQMSSEFQSWFGSIVNFGCLAGRPCSQTKLYSNQSNLNELNLGLNDKYEIYYSRNSVSVAGKQYFHPTLNYTSNLKRRNPNENRIPPR